MNRDVLKRRIQPRRRKRRRRAKQIPKVLFLVAVLVLLIRTAYRGIGTMAASLDPQPPISAAQSHVPFSSVETVEAPTDDRDSTDWYLRLVNREHPIPEDYAMERTTLSNGQSVDSRIYPALQRLFDAARTDGIYPIVASGYRTAETQKMLMQEKVEAYRAAGYTLADAKIEAEKWVALPGTSEHQLGIAVDINADGVRSEGQEVYDWLSQNAYSHGFILRYPPDKTDLTGTIYEPWHYRYVGIEVAEVLYRQGLCLEEYCAMQP